jgi:cell division septal protein FtsQ
MTVEMLKQEIIKDPWIKDLYIQKKFPDSLKINIIEYNPFAILGNDSKKLELIDEYGDTINISQEEVKKFNYLLIIVGDNFKDEINGLFNLLSVYYNITNNLVRVERISNRRWNLTLKNKIVVKMPEEDGDNVYEAWNTLSKILDIYGVEIDLEEIDLRIKNRVFMKYSSDAIKEIKNFY